MRQDLPDQDLPWQVSRIIQVAHDLQASGSTAASTGEHIAAAFVLDRLDLLPDEFSRPREAWDRLGNWQLYVRQIKRHHMHLVQD